MYKAIIVDDEKNIREGIQKNCDWKKYNINAVYTAQNGKDALEIIKKVQPDIVITDVKMPEMTGLELIKTVAPLYPDILFAILSGYDEFEFAQEALKYNVQDYILKPCNIELIHQLLKKLTDRLDQSNKKQQYIQAMKDNYIKAKSQLQEQIIRDYITNSTIIDKDTLEQLDLSPIKGIDLRLLIFRIDKLDDQSSLLALKEMCKEYFSHKHTLFLCSLNYKNILILTEYYAFPILNQELNEIRTLHSQYYGKPITIAVSEKTCFERLKSTYSNLLICMKSTFYREDGNIITACDLPGQSTISIDDYLLDYVILAIKSGNKAETFRLLDSLFQQLNNPSFSIEQIKSYTVKLYVSIIQQAEESKINNYLSGITKIMKNSNLKSIKDILVTISNDIIENYYKNVQKRQNELIYKMDKIIEKHLYDEKLSLNFIAHEILFVNVDYLGKLFISEKNEKFSRYITRRRIEKAQSLFLQNNNMQVNEVALQTGFGNNAQYFSKVFKSYTGYTPREYKNKFFNPESGKQYR
jgi:two-component system response regulator YesN